jgi:hypothetical protein
MAIAAPGSGECSAIIEPEEHRSLAVGCAYLVHPEFERHGAGRDRPVREPESATDDEPVRTRAT